MRGCSEVRLLGLMNRVQRKQVSGGKVKVSIRRMFGKRRSTIYFLMEV